MELFFSLHKPHSFIRNNAKERKKARTKEKGASARYKKHVIEVIRLFDDSPLSVAIFENLLGFLQRVLLPSN